MRIKNLIITIITCFLIASPAHSQDLTAHDQKDLQATLSALLNIIKQSYALNQTFTVSYDQEPEVTLNGDHYKVTMPAVSFALYQPPGSTTQPESKNKITLAPFTMTAKPTEGYTSWQVLINLPETLMISVSDKSPPAIMMLNQENTKQSLGVLDKRLGYFTKLHLNFENIDLIPSEKNSEERSITADIDEITFHMNFKETGIPSYYDIQSYFQMSGLNLVNHQDTSAIKVSSIRGEYVADEMRVYPAEEFTHIIKKNNDFLKKLSEQDSNQDFDYYEMIEALKETYFQDLKGFYIGYDLSDLAVVASRKENRADKSFQLSKMNFAFGAKNLKRNDGSVFLRANADGVQDIYQKYITSKEDHKIFPDQFNIDIELQNIPFVKLTNIFEETLPALIESDNLDIVMGAATQALGTMIQAKTRLMINESFISNDTYKALISGPTRVGMSTIVPFSTKLSLDFTGLDALVTALQNKYTHDQKNVNEPKFDTLKYLHPLMKLQQITKKQGMTDHFDIHNTDNGKMRINKYDFGILFEKPKK